MVVHTLSNQARACCTYWLAMSSSPLAAKWNSINPYLFTHARSWWLNQAVSPQWIRDQLSLPAQSIRFDRILDEAHATGGDIRRLMDLFGISVETAHRYVRTVVKAGPDPTIEAVRSR